MSLRELPVSPNLRQLRQQAKDLLRDFNSNKPEAVALVKEHGLRPTALGEAKLADAQRALVRRPSCSPMKAGSSKPAIGRSAARRLSDGDPFTPFPGSDHTNVQRSTELIRGQNRQELVHVASFLGRIRPSGQNHFQTSGLVACLYRSD